MRPVSELGTEYFQTLRREKNPSLWVTDWMSQRLMDVEWSLDSGAEAVIELCIENNKEFIQARGFNSQAVTEILINFPYPEQVKADYRLMFNKDAAAVQASVGEELVLLSI